MFHDLDYGDSSLQLFNCQLEVSHRCQFQGLMKVNVCQKVKPFVRIGFMGLLILAHDLNLVQNCDSMRFLQMFSRGNNTKNWHNVFISEISPEGWCFGFLKKWLFNSFEIWLINKWLGEVVFQEWAGKKYRAEHSKVW